MRKISLWVVAIFLCLATATSYAAPFTLTSNSFPDQGKIPNLYGCDGKNISPHLKWSNAPAGTQAFALVFTSPDWSAGYIYLWVVYNIPSSVFEFVEGVSKALPDDTSSILVGNNYYHEATYRGPCPPDVQSHHYVFTVYALDAMLDLNGEEEPDEVMKLINKHGLGQATMGGIFSHK